MRTNLIFILLIIAGLVYGCRNRSGDTIEDETKSKSDAKVSLSDEERKELYQKVKEKKMEKLSNKEKQKTVEDWVTLLRNDPDFINAENSLQDYTSEIANRDREKDTQNEDKRPDRKKDMVGYYDSRGIQNPDTAASSQLNLIKSYLIILQKYPELREIDKPTRKLILSRAANQTNFSDIKEKRKR